QSDYLVCWSGAVGALGGSVLPSCDLALSLAPMNPTYHNARGMARTEVADYKGAIEDFKASVEWSREQGVYEQYGRKREAWIAELEKGRNPFDKATLEALQHEGD